MTNVSGVENEVIELNVKPDSVIDFMYKIDEQQLPWSLDADSEKSKGHFLAFVVAQDGAETGMEVVLYPDGTWKGVYTASIKLEA